MTPAQFNAWLAEMGLSERRAAELLGVARSSVQDWRRGVNRTTGEPMKLPAMLGLACAAIRAGLAPVGD